MQIESVLSSVPIPIDQVITVEGVLMENACRPYLGRFTRDWAGPHCIRLTDEGLFDRLIDLLFPHTIGGGNTCFFYPVVAVGVLGQDPHDNTLTLTNLQSMCIDVSGKSFTFLCEK